MKKKHFLSFAVMLFAMFLLLSTESEAKWKNYSKGRRKYYVVSTKSYLKKTWKKIGGKWYYFDKKGWQKNGRFKVGKNYFYVEKSTGRVENRKIDDYYYGEGGVMVKNAWVEIGENSFYFGSDGKMVTGRFKIDKEIYYCRKETGKVVNERIGRYYYGEDGAAVKRQWVGAYYHGASGRAKYGQFTVKGKTYYCTKEKGKLTSQWVDKHYYDKNGVMATERWINGSYLDANGDIIKGNMNPPTEDEIQLLTAITYLESGNQSYYGKQCVASVVINRVNSDLFPNTLEEVIYQSGQFQPAYNIKYVLDGSMKVNETSWKECRKAAKHVLTKGSVLEGYYYFNIYSGKIKIGDHYFS